MPDTSSPQSVEREKGEVKGANFSLFARTEGDLGVVFGTCRDLQEWQKHKNKYDKTFWF